MTILRANAGRLSRRIKLIWSSIAHFGCNFQQHGFRLVPPIRERRYLVAVLGGGKDLAWEIRMMAELSPLLLGMLVGVGWE